MSEYEDHLSTWGASCGAPLAVYKGHLDALLTEQRKAAEDRCANVVSVLHSTSKSKALTPVTLPLTAPLV